MSGAVSVERQKPVMAMDAKKFAMWIFLVSVSMLFIALTSAYIVKKSDGNWLIFDMPQAFVYSTILIVLSSASMHWAYVSTKTNQILQIRAALGLTFILGVLFLVSQWVGWIQLTGQDVFWVGNVAGSFIYVLTGLHGIHLISAFLYLLWVFVMAFRYRVHSKSLLNMEMCATYWHFLGGLWLYLYLFLVLNN